MTRQNYIKLAAALKSAKPDGDSVAAAHTWEKTVEAIAYVLKQDNPRFDYTRFFNACGYEC